MWGILCDVEPFSSNQRIAVCIGCQKARIIHTYIRGFYFAYLLLDLHEEKRQHGREGEGE